MEEHGEEKTKRLMRYAGAGSLTREEAGEILRTVWPDAPMREVTKAAIICQQYGLNPLMKHLFLICFNKGTQKETWATVMGIQATRLKAHERESFSYVDNTPRIMTAQEQETTFGEVDKENIWAITKVRDAKGNVAPGYGSWPKVADVYGREKGNSRFNMAAIRSERQALDRLFGGMLPVGVETVDERYVESPYQVVDEETGEITSPETPEEANPGNPTAQAPQAPPAATVERLGLDEKVRANAKQAERLFDQQAGDAPFGPVTSGEPQPKTKLKDVLPQDKAGIGEIKYLRNLAQRKGQTILEEELARLTPEEASNKISEWGQLKDKPK